MALTRLGGNQSINLATNTTGTLGVANGGTGLASGTSGQFLKFTGSTTLASAASGINMADQWRLNSSFTGSASPITSNLERVDTAGQGTIGSAMTVSSGIFTFPSTGIYLVRFTAGMYIHNNSDRTTGFAIEATTNNSSYTEVAMGSMNMFNSSDNTTSVGSCETYIDVTDTANVKVRFMTFPQRSTTAMNASSTSNKFTFTFIRLGDT